MLKYYIVSKKMFQRLYQQLLENRLFSEFSYYNDDLLFLFLRLKKYETIEHKEIIVVYRLFLISGEYYIGLFVSFSVLKD